MGKEESVFFNHILDAISYVESYTKDVSINEFMFNHLIQDGVIRQLEIIGEAVKSISDETRSQYSDIPWQDMAGMRDILIHQYFGVDLDEVWTTVQMDIPKVKMMIQKIIDSMK